MANLSVQPGTTAGIDIFTMAAASAGGDSFVNTGRELVIIKNGDASPHTATFVTPVTVDGQVVADKAVVIPASSHIMVIGPFSPSYYNDASGNVAITYDAVTSVTIAVIKVPQAS